MSAWERLLADSSWCRGAGGRGGGACPRALGPGGGAGAVAGPGRQGPATVDAVRLERAGAGEGILEGVLHRPEPGGALGCSRGVLRWPAVALFRRAGAV